MITWYSEGKKRKKWFCSNFMSFSPIDFIFIGCIGYDDKFCWVLRNFDFKPANEIFSKKGEMSFFQKTCFLGVWPRKLTLSKIGVMDMSYITDSGQIGHTQLSLTFFINIGRSGRFIKKSKIVIFWKKSRFLESKMCSRGAKSGSIRIAR